MRVLCERGRVACASGVGVGGVSEGSGTRGCYFALVCVCRGVFGLFYVGQRARAERRAVCGVRALP